MILTRSKINQFFDQYFSATQGRRVSRLSVKNYRSTISRFYTQFNRLDDSTVRKFLATYSNPASANVVLVRLNALAEYLDAPLKVTRAKEKVKDPDALTSSEVARLINACFKQDATLGHVARLLANTGLRIHELYGLTRDSLQYRDGIPVLSILGKGQKYRDVPLSTESLSALESLTLPLHASVSDKSLREGLAEAGEQAGLPIHVHPHLLRASCASIMLNERKIDSVTVAKLLGWAKTDTLLKHYYKASISTLANAVI